MLCVRELFTTQLLSSTAYPPPAPVSSGAVQPDSLQPPPGLWLTPSPQSTFCQWSGSAPAKPPPTVLRCCLCRALEWRRSFSEPFYLPCLLFSLQLECFPPYFHLNLLHTLSHFCCSCSCCRLLCSSTQITETLLFFAVLVQQLVMTRADLLLQFWQGFD